MYHESILFYGHAVTFCIFFLMYSEPKLKATLSLHPKDGNLVLGKEYELQCKPELNIPGMDIDYSRLDCTYKWHKKGEKEPRDITKGILSLKSFEFSDAGCYTCTVTVKKIIFLIVTSRSQKKEMWKQY